VVVDEGAQGSPEVAAVGDQHPVQTLAPYDADKRPAIA
jgi:hypothetical protein